MAERLPSQWDVRRRRLVAIILYVFGIGGIGGAPRTVAGAAPAPEWNAKFEGKSGWIGGDGVYSAPLSPIRMLWIFSDSLIGRTRDNQRVETALVNNTIAIQAGPRADAAIAFSNGLTPGGKPGAVIIPTDGKGWFWPQSAVRVGSDLAIFLPRIEKTGDGGAFGFQQTGLSLAMIENPSDDPLRWRLTQCTVPHARFENGNQVSWGSAVLVDHETIYVYGYEQRKVTGAAKGLLVARAPASRLADFASWRFRSADGWSKSVGDACPLAEGMGAEFSVCAAPPGYGLILVYTDKGLSDRIMGRFANSPEGPWSAPKLLYQCPENHRDKGVFCYAAKAHGWASEGNRLLISYCVNSWRLERLFQDEKVYRPKFVWVEFQAKH
ncbi:MAG TPA: DUF4185 domain-containing protein [Tepidisphaeraceae bacterium]|jgi:hypothetical protein|nr:DUF4185 domain-containing protein [Tepidisphaeraceae bacterium]